MPLFPLNSIAESTAKGARSTALQPLQWVLGMLLTALSPALWLGAPAWLTAALGIAGAVVLLVLLGSYVYLLIRSPDALRSESYTLRKMEIEKGLVGDNISGVYDPASVDSNRPGLVLNDISRDQEP